MLITYIDESQRGDQYYFIGALMVTGTALVKVEETLNAVVADAAALHSGLPGSAELHAREVFQGEGPWEGVPPRIRVRVCQQTIAALADSGARFVLRGTDRPALKAKYPEPHPVHELTLSHALEEVNRQILEHHDPAMSTLVIADEHHLAEDSRRRFKHIRLLSGDGYSQTPLTKLADTLYFGPSHHSRLLQAADMATFFHNRLRTVTETDPRSQRAMAVIKTDLERFTVNDYVWARSPKVRNPRIAGGPAAAGDPRGRPALSILRDLTSCAQERRVLPLAMRHACLAPAFSRRGVRSRAARAGVVTSRLRTVHLPSTPVRVVSPDRLAFDASSVLRYLRDRRTHGSLPK